MSDLHVNEPVTGAAPLASFDQSGSGKAGVIFPSASRIVAAFTSPSMHNPNARGVRLFCINDGAGGSTLTVKIQIKDPNSGGWVDLTGAVTTALGAVTSIITVYPGLTGTADIANLAINQHLGSEWRVVATVAVATGTSSVGADYLL